MTIIAPHIVSAKLRDALAHGDLRGKIVVYMEIPEFNRLMGSLRREDIVGVRSRDRLDLQGVIYRAVDKLP